MPSHIGQLSLCAAFASRCAPTGLAMKMNMIASENLDMTCRGVTSGCCSIWKAPARSRPERPSVTPLVAACILW